MAEPITLDTAREKPPKPIKIQEPDFTPPTPAETGLSLVKRLKAEKRAR